MRNLKKILAMVLALIMSLSLMATAGAVDFKDAEAVEASNYRQAIEVLNGLGVFNGDQNGNFNPEAPITRAEVAAIIYRITTGDVNGDGKDSYSVYDNQFTDVKDTDWFAGYVSYCHNAGYVKGHADKTFGPNNPVTGYQALAMILRAVGYDKNNEFVGDNWQINTASRATTEGVLDNVKGEPLGVDAARQLVAEILFRSILLNNVQWNIVKQDYDKLNTRVCDTLGLKEITGVVLANEAADLGAKGSSPIAKGTSRILVKDVKDGDNQSKIVKVGDEITVNVGSGLDDIGEMRLVYVTATNRNTFKPVVSELYPVEPQNIKDNDYNSSRNLGSVSATAKAEGLSVDAGSTEYFIDYDPATSVSTTSDWRIRYVIDVTGRTNADGSGLADLTLGEYNIVRKNTGLDKDAISRVVKVSEDNKATFPGHSVGDLVYERIIRIGETITAYDQELIFDIFDLADKFTTPDDVDSFRSGEVYVGTASYEDKSDIMSWETFKKTYFKNTDNNGFTGIENGNFVKVVDVDDDGVVDYVLKREYALDRVTAILDNGTIHFASGAVCEENSHTHRYASDIQHYSLSVNFGDVEPKVGDVFLRNYIDGTWYGEIVEPEIITVKTVNWSKHLITDTEGNDYYQSGIVNDTSMDDDITAMQDLVEYKIYRDKGGYIRAYELAQGSQYGLLTEMYPTGVNNGAFVTNARWITELMTMNDSSPIEYNLLNSYINGYQNVFIDNSRANPFQVAIGTTYGDYLQEAVARLGIEAVTDSADATDHNGEEFKYAAGETWTNVARYTKSENGVNLYTASELATRNGQQLYYAWIDDATGPNANGDHDQSEKLDILGYGTDAGNVTLKKGQKVTATEVNAYNAQMKKLNPDHVNVKADDLEPVYAVDYIKLDANKSIAAGAKHYDIAAANGTADDYGYINNGYVDSVNDTEYYLVSGNSVRTFTGYQNMPAIDAQYIRAIYTVAENTTKDLNQNDYWVARVIVIEITGAYAFDSISLAYNNPYQTTAQVHGIDTLNNESKEPELEVKPQDLIWSDRWNEMAFYGLVGEALSEDGSYVTTNTMERIGKWGKTDNGDYIFKYNANHIYAGTIARKTTITGQGGYFDVYKGHNETQRTTLPTTAKFYGLRQSGRDIVADGPHSIVESSISIGDKIIWVTNARGEVAFIVDLGYSFGGGTVNKGGDLNAEWTAIMEEQAGTNTISIVPDYTFYGYDNTQIVNKEHADPNDDSVTFTFNNGVYIRSFSMAKDGKAVNTSAKTAGMYRYNSTRNQVTIDLDAPSTVAVKWSFVFSLEVNGQTATYSIELTQAAAGAADLVGSSNVPAEEAVAALVEAYRAYAADNTKIADLYAAAAAYKPHADTDTDVDAQAAYAETKKLANKLVSDICSAAVNTFANIKTALALPQDANAATIADWGNGSAPATGGSVSLSGKNEATYNTAVANIAAAKPIYDSAKTLVEAYDNFNNLALLPSDKPAARTAYEAAHEAFKTATAQATSWRTNTETNVFTASQPTTVKTAYENLPVDAEITSIEMNANMKAVYGATFDASGLQAETPYVTITYAKGTPSADVPSINDLGDVWGWFSKAEVPGPGVVITIKTNNPGVDQGITVPEKNVIKVAGVNGGDDLTVEVRFVESSAPVYYASIWSGASGSVCMALLDMGTHEWLSQSEIKALNLTENSATFTVQGVSVPFSTVEYGDNGQVYDDTPFGGSHNTTNSTPEIAGYIKFIGNPIEQDSNPLLKVKINAMYSSMTDSVIGASNTGNGGTQTGPGLKVNAIDGIDIAWYYTSVDNRANTTLWS